MSFAKFDSGRSFPLHAVILTLIDFGDSRLLVEAVPCNWHS